MIGNTEAVDVEPSEKWLNAGGFRTRYLEAGNPRAPVVVLLHDGAWGGASSVTWANVIPRLSERYRVLAPDLLGFGGTDKVVFVDRAQYEPRILQLRAFLQALAIHAPVHLIGNSFGGSLGLRALAAREAFPIRSVVSICGSGGPGKTELSLAELKHWDGTENDLRRIVDLLIDGTPYYAAQLSERMRWAADIGHYRAVKAASTPLPPALGRPRVTDPWPSQLDGFSTPIMLVSGQRDVLLQPSWTAMLTAIVPHARVESLDCKHSPNIDRPELLLPVLLHFLDRS